LVVFPVLCLFLFFLYYIYIFFSTWELVPFFFFIILFSFLATHHPHVGVFLFVSYMERRRGIGKGWRRAVVYSVAT